MDQFEDAEAALIGAILVNPQALNLVAEAGMEERMLANPLYRAAYRAAVSLASEGRETDVPEVWLKLREQGQDVPADALHAAASMVGSGRNAPAMAQRVLQAWQRREILRVASQAHDMAEHNEAAPDELLAAIQDLFSGVALRRGSRAPKKLIEVAYARIDRLQAAAEGVVENTSWGLGIPALDRLLGGGLRPGGLYILAARPSVGKSSFAESLALHVARHGHAALFLSQEMPAEEVADRAISNVSRVSYDAISRASVMDDGQWGQLADAMSILHEAPIWIDDESALTLQSIRRKAQFRPGLRLLVLDYLQLCATAGRQNRTAEIGEISRGLKALAKDLGIAIIALSQLNRDVEKRTGGRPVLSDLRDSGEIEQDADAVMFLWRLDKPEAGEPVQRIGCALAKNRQGRIGDLTLAFQGDTQVWGEMAEGIAD